MVPVTHSTTTYITLSAVIPCLHVHATIVASVHKAIAGLIVKFIEHRHGGILGPAKGGELPVSLTRHGQEGVPAIHEITADELVRVCGARERRGGAHLRRLEENYEEHL